MAELAACSKDVKCGSKIGYSLKEVWQRKWLFVQRIQNCNGGMAARWKRCDSKNSCLFERCSKCDCKTSCLFEGCKSVAAELAALSKDAPRIAACWKDARA